MSKLSDRMVLFRAALIMAWAQLGLHIRCLSYFWPIANVPISPITYFRVKSRLNLLELYLELYFFVCLCLTFHRMDQLINCYFLLTVYMLAVLIFKEIMSINI